MLQLEIEKGDLSPKTIEVVTATPCFPPKGIKSVEKTRDSVKVTVTERSSSHFPPKKKLARQLVFTEFGLSPIITTSPPLPVVKPSSKMDMSPRSPFSSIYKSDSPIPIPRANTIAKNGTTKGPKRCGCKQSKCLKLYCECFASGEYCNACTCADCCNTVENGDLRKVAVGIILERNPHAFKPKIASSLCSSQDFGGDKDDAPRVARHERGCHCKRSECLKRYCECFQANVFCSENCKCLDCKNFEVCKEMVVASGKDDSKSKICKNSEGCEERTAISLRDNGNREIYKISEGPERLMAVTGEDCIDSKIYIQKITVATSNATGLSGQSFSQESRKRKHLELHSNDKDSPIQSFSDFQNENNQEDSCPSASLSVEPTCRIDSSVMMRSSRHSYSARLMLPDAFYLEATTNFCSGLAVLAEAAALAQVATTFADKVGKEEMKDVEEKNGDTIGAKEVNCQDEPVHVQKRVLNDLCQNCAATDAQEGITLPPGTVNLIYSDEKQKQLMGPTSLDQILNRNLKNAYAEQERSILSSFRDFLEELIITNIKGTSQFSSGIC